MFSVLRVQRGYSLTELMLMVGVAGTLMAIAVPLTSDITAATKLNEAARQVEREFAEARFRAVSSNRALRVRTNCPDAGFIRTIEVFNPAVDGTADRCRQQTYPFPPDDDLMTRPNYDGPLRPLANGASVGTVTFQFQPDGTILNVVANVVTAMAAEQTVTISRMNKSRSVKVNGAGKIQLQ